MNEMSEYADICGLLLAGGMSGRMGQDKALLRPFGANGPDMLALGYGLLRGLLPQAWVSSVRGRPYADYPCLFDRTPSEGPIAGIMVGLRAAQAAGLRAVLVLACDMPLMDAPTLHGLLAARPEPPQLATMYTREKSGYLEPLCAIYAVEALPYLEAAVASGRRCIPAAFPEDAIRALAYGEAESRAFFNMNTPADLARLAREYGRVK